MTRRHHAALALGFLAAGCGLAAFGAGAPSAPKIDPTPYPGDRYPPRRTAFPAGVTGFADVTYAMVSGFRPLTLDVYVGPHAPGASRPLVLYIHGGGWSLGHARQAGAFDDWPGVLASLAARGYTVASLNYRLSGEAPFPAPLRDVKAAIRFLRAHAAEYDIDPAKALVWGGSAGGHLAALAATTCGVREFEPVASAADGAGLAAPSDCVQGAVTWYGVFDLSTQRGGTDAMGAMPPNVAQLLGCAAAACTPELAQRAGAQHYVSADLPPFLVIHGQADTTVDPQQSIRFKDAMTRAGAHADLVLIPGVGHSFVGANPDATRAASLLALDRTFAFIDATLK